MPKTDRPFPRLRRLPEFTYADPASAFHLVIRARINSAPFRGEMGDAVWDVLARERADGQVRVTAACLMPDHLHVIVFPRGRSVIRWVNAFKSLTTRAAWEAGWRGRLWQPRYYDHLIRDEEEYWTTVAYIRENPVVAGVVGSAEE